MQCHNPLISIFSTSISFCGASNRLILSKYNNCENQRRKGGGFVPLHIWVWIANTHTIFTFLNVVVYLLPITNLRLVLVLVLVLRMVLVLELELESPLREALRENKNSDTKIICVFHLHHWNIFRLLYVHR